MLLYIVDTTLLSNFAHASRPALLELILQNRGVTTKRVMAELVHGETQGLVPHFDWHWLEVAETSAEEAALAEEFERIVHRTEAECLAIAIVREGVFLSDDFAARRLAASQGVRISGTLGVLRALVEQGVLAVDEADALLDRMRAQGYRSPVRSLHEL